MAILTYGCRRDANYECFGASSPTDLTLSNDCDVNKIVRLYARTGTNDFQLIKSVEVETNKRLTTCLENEGPIVDGLYLRFDDGTKLIKLKYGEEFKLSLCDSTFQIPNMGALN